VVMTRAVLVLTAVPRTLSLSRASGRHRGGRPPIVLDELSGVTARPTVIPINPGHGSWAPDNWRWYDWHRAGSTSELAIL